MITLPTQMHRHGGTVGDARVRVDRPCVNWAMPKRPYTGTFPTSECASPAHPARPLGAST